MATTKMLDVAADVGHFTAPAQHHYLRESFAGPMIAFWAIERELDTIVIAQGTREVGHILEKRLGAFDALDDALVDVVLAKASAAYGRADMHGFADVEPQA